MSRSSESVQVTGNGSVGIAGDNHAPIDIAVTTIVEAPVIWPACVGIVPTLASAYLERHDLPDDVLGAAGTTRVLTGEGGVGKTQMAAWFAHQAIENRMVDLVVWVPASSADQVVTAFAHAAARIGLPGANAKDRESDARAFRQWLEVAERTWLIVLDDITQPEDVAGWWPPDRSTGRTVATTRRRDAAMTGSGRIGTNVVVFAVDQSRRYLIDRLMLAGLPHLVDQHADDLATALGNLPLALAHAAAYLINQEKSTHEYLQRFAGGRERLADLMPADSDPDEYGNPVNVTLLLAREVAERADPSGLVRPALALAAVFDSAGHPDALWRTDPVVAYLDRYRDRHGLAPTTTEDVDKVLRLMHRFGLLTHRRQDIARAVRMHALTGRAVRETPHLFPNPEVVAKAAADAVLAIWPDQDHITDGFSDVLRSNVNALIAQTGDSLWYPQVHPMVWKAGSSLYTAGLHSRGASYWQECLHAAELALGDQHPDTIAVRARLARAYRHGGRMSEALAIDERVLADLIAVLGRDHPDTLAAKHNLAGDHRALGRFETALPLYESVVADRRRVLGPEHADTLWSQNNLAWVFTKTGQHEQALSLNKQVAATRDRILGPDHPDTLWSLHNIAADLRGLGRDEEALLADTTVAAGRERLLGRLHPDTLASYNNVAWNYSNLGRHEEALALHEQLSTDRLRVLGPEHPDTLWSRAATAVDLTNLGRHEEARVLHEQVARDRLRVLGPDHPNTLWSHHHLADEYRRLGRFAEALNVDMRVTSARRRLLGDDHPDTVRSENNLAWDYSKLGRHVEAGHLKRRVVAALSRRLGPDHPDTLTARHHAVFAHRVLGEFETALRLDCELLAARARILGEDNLDTLATRHNIAWNYAAMARYDEALRLDRQVLNDRVRILGNDHIDTSWSRSAVAFDLRGLGRYEEALAMTRQVASDRARILGEDHYDTLWARHNLAWDLANLGKFRAALRIDKQVLSRRERLNGIDHVETLWSRAAVARDYRGLGQNERSLSIIRAVAAERSRVLGADHPDTLRADQILQQWQGESE